MRAQTAEMERKYVIRKVVLLSANLDIKNKFKISSRILIDEPSGVNYTYNYWMKLQV
jgi:hypothetical protein